MSPQPVEPTLIAAVYGGYDRWLGPFLESALTTGHTKFLLVCDLQQEPVIRDLFHLLGPSPTTTSVAGDRHFEAMLREPGVQRLAHLAAWRKAISTLPPGSPFACVHVDTILQRNLTAAWVEATPKPFGLAVAGQRYANRWIFPPTLLCGQAGPAVVAEMDNLIREASRLALSPEKAPAALYGSYEAAAMAVLMSRMLDGGSTIIAQLKPTWLSGLDPQAGVVHFAGQPPDPATVLGDRWTTLGQAWEERMKDTAEA